MMLALHDRESDVDAFQFVLAEKLHMSLEEVARMPMLHYVQWQGYFASKAAIASVRGG